MWTSVMLLSTALLPAAPTAEEIQKAEQDLQAQLKEWKAPNALRVGRISDEALERSFANRLFFTGLLPQFPVGIAPAPGSKIQVSNLFVVGKDGKVLHLTDAKGLEAFFKESLPAAKNEAALKDAARAWLALSPEFRQDGFFKFKLMDDSTKAEGKKATAQVVVMQGGNGSITATLTFDDAGKLAQVTEEAKIRPGPRPICQATKLLDPDPIVRKMAEQDLLCMGRAAHDYLMQQRAKAVPELQQAIDRMWQRILQQD